MRPKQTRPEPELVSLLDCDTCRAIAPSEKAATWGPPPQPPPVPAAWARLSTVAVLAWRRPAPWGDRDELRMCASCGTYYEYHQGYNSGELFEAEGTEWYLNRLAPRRARALLDWIPAPHRTVEKKAFKRRYPRIIQTFRSDLARCPADADRSVQAYIIAALTEHDLLAGDWNGLKMTLVSHPAPSVRVPAAANLLSTLSVFRDRDVKGPLLDAADTLLTAKRKDELVAVLGEGLSHDDEVASTNGSQSRVESVAVTALEKCARHLTIRPALPALAAWLSGDDKWRRVHARDVLLGHAADPWRRGSRIRTPALRRRRTRDVLECVAGIGTEEAHAVMQHCRDVLGAT